LTCRSDNNKIHTSSLVGLHPEKVEVFLFMQDLEKIASYQRRLILNKTFFEARIENLLIKNKVYFEFQYPIVADDNNFYILDFFFPKYKCYIELDGKQHLNNKKYDKTRKDTIYNLWKLREIRLTNTKSLKISFNDLMLLVKGTKNKSKIRNRNVKKCKYFMSKIDRNLQRRYDNLKK
jgi:very-short-patch-repair endonuclease